MKRFTELFTTLDQTTRTSAKVDALVDYLADTEAEDAAWAVYFLSGEKLKRLVPTKLLRQWAAEIAGIEGWLFDECYEITGDLAEVMSLILPPPVERSEVPLHQWIVERLKPLRAMDANEQRAAIESFWRQLSQPESFVLHKLITGSFRVGVSKGLVIRALARHADIEAETLAHRLMGDWEPTGEALQALLDPDTRDTEVSRPYAFFLAHPMEKQETLGDVEQWHVEWKWDGIRAQLIRREGQTFIWSRGEDLMTEQFPEIVEAARTIPDGTVLDGELVAFKNGRVLPFNEMQRRIGRKKPGKQILTRVPVSLIVFDLLEWQGADMRERPLDWRRDQLESLLERQLPTGSAPETANHRPPASKEPSVTRRSSNEPSKHQTRLFGTGEESMAESDRRLDAALQISAVLPAARWDEIEALRQRARAEGTEGLMLKRRSSPYRVGRPRGDWWKWKVDPYTVDAVLILAQRGHGRRASLYTDYTYGVWSDDELVPFAKAYSGLTDAEIRKVDRFIRNNTIDRFGPVRSVTPSLVFELAFENIQPSSRHKSGVAVRFPRIVRWREDLGVKDADSLKTIEAMMNASETLR